MISVAPMKPGLPPPAGSGNSSSVPTRFANVFRNSPSAGSSGITTSRGEVWGTPAASASTGADDAGRRVRAGGQVLGDVSDIVARSTSGSIRSGSLWSDRNV